MYVLISVLHKHILNVDMTVHTISVFGRVNSTNVTCLVHIATYAAMIIVVCLRHIIHTFRCFLNHTNSYIYLVHIFLSSASSTHGESIRYD